MNKEDLKNAICNNDIEFLKRNKSRYLINECFEDEDNDTLLLYSISDASTEIYKFFLEENADIHLSNDLGENVIHAIVYSGDVERLKYFTNKYSIDINHRAKDGATPLLLAISLKRIKLAEFLMKLGADVNIPDNDGIAPIHIASQGNNKKILNELLKNQADPFLKTEKGNLPLALAVNNGNYEIVKILYEKTFGN